MKWRSPWNEALSAVLAKNRVERILALGWRRLERCAMRGKYAIIDFRGNDMPYEVLERKFRSLPEQSFAEVSQFFDYILYKFGTLSAEKENGDSIDQSLVERINAACEKHPMENFSQDATVAAMWEAVKNDSW